MNAHIACLRRNTSLSMRRHMDVLSGGSRKNPAPHDVRVKLGKELTAKEGVGLLRLAPPSWQNKMNPGRRMFIVQVVSKSYHKHIPDY